MTQAIRKTDKDNGGHSVTTQTAKTVMINNLPIAIKTSRTNDGATIITGSTTVIIENQPVARVGDKTNKGYVFIKGSSDVDIK